MKRDFTLSAKENLKSLITQVENEKWCDFTDWFGDRWYDFEDLIGTLDSKKYIDNINAYHKKVIDKNNTSASEIDSIFNAVYNISSTYATKFSAGRAQLGNFKSIIDSMAEMIDPKSGYSPKQITSTLKSLHGDYETNNNILNSIIGEGLDENSLDDYDETQLANALNDVASNVLDLMPNLTLGQTVEIAVGAGLVISYSVKGKIDGESDATVNATIEDQKVDLKNVSWSKSTSGVLSGSISVDSDGKTSVSLSAPNSSVSLDSDSINGTATYKVGNNTYKFETEFKIEEVKVQESVTTDLGGGSITSTLALKKKNNTGWTPPTTVPVYEPTSVSVPSFNYNVDWQAVGETSTKVVATGVIVWLGIKAVEIGVTIATGGATAPILAVG